MADEHELLSKVLPGYELGGELGRGGWGVVYAAEHRTLERHVAVKYLPQAFAADPSARTRFRSEARVVASLDHPHIVPLYDFVESDDMCVFVMELMPGGTLWDQFSDKGVTPGAACAVTFAVLSALAHAHERGVLHRDIKPENVLFNAGGVPKLADFGIAKVLGDAAGARTATGTIMGTPAYMAPEQGSGEPVSPATDYYAVGVMLFEMLSGRLPFESTGNPLSQLYRHVYEAPPSLRELAPSVPEPLAAVVMRALAKAPEDRHESAEAFAVALDTAASMAFGSDWVTAAGVPVLAKRDMLGDTGGHRLPAQPPPAEAPATVLPPPPTGSLPPPPATSLPPPPAASLPPPSPTVTTAGPDAKRSSTRVWIAAGAAVVLLLALGGAMVMAGGDGERTPQQLTEVPRAAEARFKDRCRTESVPDRICECALERSLSQLTVAQFLDNDFLLQQDGESLTAEVIEIFDGCVEDFGDPPAGGTEAS